jgi:hypothetical protein
MDETESGFPGEMSVETSPIDWSASESMQVNEVEHQYL